MEKLLLVHGWFTQSGLRINSNPQNTFPLVYKGDGMWMFHGRFFFKRKEDTEFEGIIHDLFGIAEVKGTFKSDKLDFGKKYTHRPDTIRYNLTQNVLVPAEFSGSYNNELVGAGNVKLSLTEPSQTFFQL